MEIASRLADDGDWEPPCHEQCQGMIRVEHEGESFPAQCPLHLTAACPIPDFEMSRRRDEMVRSGWPKRYALSDWDQCRAKDQLREWLDQREPHEGMILHGPVGTGKTSAAFLVAEALWGQYYASFAPWSEIADTFSNGSGQVRREALAGWSRAGLLVVDDFGVGDVAPWGMGAVDALFENRNGGLLPTIITTNLAPDTLAGEPDWERFVDRWRESNWAISIPGKSMRHE